MMPKPLHPTPQYTLVRDQKLGKNSYESKAKGVSISASVLSILVYISVFYIFNLSPALVFNSSKFWFILSNTLIIIIAADYGSFSSSSDRVDDPYDDYVAKSRQPLSASYHQPYYINTPIVSSSTFHLKNPHDHDEDDVVEKNMIISSSVETIDEEEVTKEIDVVDDHLWTFPTQDTVWESISKEADHKVQNTHHKNMIINHSDANINDRRRVKKFRRTASEKLSLATQAVKNERKNVIRRWESERHEPQVSADGNEIDEDQEQEGVTTGDEFAKMSDEELNRRVEEFIQKFNRHIRLERSINF